MAYSLSGSTITQSGTDANLGGITVIPSVIAPSGGRLYSTTNIFRVTGAQTIPVETLQANRIFADGESAVLTIGADDGSAISGGTIYVNGNASGQFGTGVFYALNGATINMFNCSVLVAANTGSSAEIGSFGATWTLNAKNVNFYKAGANRSFHYIGSGGTLENVSWRNNVAVFFNGSLLSASGLSVVGTDFGFGIDSGTPVTLVLSSSLVTRATMQRNGHAFTLLDCQITDWVSCRNIASETSFFVFSKNISASAVGPAASSTPLYILDNNLQIIDQTITDSSGLISNRQINWGRVTTSRIGQNANPNVLENKFTSDNISNNTGIGHDVGEYKLPLIAVFSKYENILSVQQNINFDVSIPEALVPFNLAPNLIFDTNITLTEAQALSKLDSSFVVNRSLNTITVTQPSTLDDLYDALKAYKTRPIVEQLNYPTAATQPVTASGRTLVTSLNILGLEFLTNGSKFDSLQTPQAISSGTINDISIIGNILQNVPTNINNVSVSGSLSYNTNSNFSIVISNSTIENIENNGSGIVTVSLINSTILNSSDPQINLLNSSITFEDCELTDQVLIRRLSDGFILYTVNISDGDVFVFSVGANLGVQVYFERLNSSGITLLSTFTTINITLGLGNNGIVSLIDPSSVPSLAQTQAYFNTFGGKVVWEYVERTLTSSAGGSYDDTILQSKIDVIDSNVDAIRAKTDTLVNTDLTGIATSAEIAALSIPTASENATAVRDELTTELARVDANISSRNSVEPDNASIAAIKAKTDTLENTDLSGVATSLEIAEVKKNTDLIPAVL